MGDVSNFLVFLAIVLIGITVIFGTDLGAKILRKKPSGAPLTDGGFEEPVTSLPPVLLPEEAKPDDVDRVRFALGLRGYRMDQVDQVLDDLRDQLAAKDAEIAGLRAHLRGEIPGSTPKQSAPDSTGFRVDSEDGTAPSDRTVAEERS
jgi:DivIVA domain-containing protein